MSQDKNVRRQKYGVYMHEKKGKMINEYLCKNQENDTNAHVHNSKEHAWL